MQGNYRVRRLNADFDVITDDVCLLVDATAGAITGRMYAMGGGGFRRLVVIQVGATNNPVNILSVNGAAVYSVVGQGAGVSLEQDDRQVWRAVGAANVPVPSIQLSRNVQAFSKNNSSLEDIAGMSADCVFNGSYSFRAVLHVDNTSDQDLLFAMGGTVTGVVRAQLIGVDNFADKHEDGVAMAGTRITALSSSVTLNKAFDCVTIDGCFIAQSDGTLVPQFAIASEVEIGAGTINLGTFEVSRIG